jgi:hypothetical protein
MTPDDVIWHLWPGLKTKGGPDMAFVRWRGCSAQLLATVYENGRSKQIVLARLPEFYASDLTKMRVIVSKAAAGRYTSGSFSVFKDRGVKDIDCYCRASCPAIDGVICP